MWVIHFNWFTNKHKLARYFAIAEFISLQYKLKAQTCHHSSNFGNHNMNRCEWWIAKKIINFQVQAVFLPQLSGLKKYQKSIPFIRCHPESRHEISKNACRKNSKTSNNLQRKIPFKEQLLDKSSHKPWLRWATILDKWTSYEDKQINNTWSCKN